MGMFDHLELVGAHDAILCSAGHECRSLQTKDLPGCLMYTYYIFDGYLYRLEPESDDYEYIPFSSFSKERARPVSLGPKVLVNAYTTCTACTPGVYPNGNKRYPWVEYIFEIDGGVVRSCTPASNSE